LKNINKKNMDKARIWQRGASKGRKNSTNARLMFEE
jgi:hypothetical protein